jgi:hypothetical protein
MLILSVMACLLCPVEAAAYVDPGTGSMLWQMAMAALVGAGFTFRKLKNAVTRTPKR